MSDPAVPNPPTLASLGYSEEQISQIRAAVNGGVFTVVPGDVGAKPSVRIATIEKVFAKKVWIESDILGDKHVMVQHDAPGEEPFCYASFHYDHRHTSNSGTLSAATSLALSLGAAEPVVVKHRALPGT